MFHFDSGGRKAKQKLFCSVLEVSMANWRDEIKHLGLDLRDGGRSLLDFRFEDDIFILAPITMIFAYSGTNLLKI